MLAIERELIITSLAELAGLVDRYQRGDPDFVPAVLSHLDALEQRLSRLRSSHVGLPAAARVAIVAAADGGAPEGETPPRRSAARRAARVAAADALRRIEEVLHGRLAQIDGRFDQLREKLNQLLAVTTPSRPIPLPPREPRSAWLADIWASVGTVPEARSMFHYLGASLSRLDREYLLGDAIENLIDALQPPSP